MLNEGLVHKRCKKPLDEEGMGKEVAVALVVKIRHGSNGNLCAAVLQVWCLFGETG